MKILEFKGKMSVKNKLLIILGVIVRNNNYNSNIIIYIKRTSTRMDE